MSMKYFVSWRENYNDECGWFDTKEEVQKLVKRIKEQIEDDDGGEPDIYFVIKGEDISETFDVESTFHL